MFRARPYLSLKTVNCMIIKSKHLIHVMVLTFYTIAEHLWNISAFFMMWNFVKYEITNGITNKITNQNLRRVSFGKSYGPFNANPCACNASPCYAPCPFPILSLLFHFKHYSHIKNDCASAYSVPYQIQVMYAFLNLNAIFNTEILPSMSQLVSISYQSSSINWMSFFFSFINLQMIIVLFFWINVVCRVNFL